jgi:hypothetical protein
VPLPITTSVIALSVILVVSPRRLGATRDVRPAEVISRSDRCRSAHSGVRLTIEARGYFPTENAAKQGGAVPLGKSSSQLRRGVGDDLAIITDKLSRTILADPVMRMDRTVRHIASR